MTAHQRTNLISHVSNKGTELIEIIVHGAANIPNSKNQSPKTYVTGQSKYTLNTQDIGDKPNSTDPVEGNNPIWNELIFVEANDYKLENEELILLLIDEAQHTNIAEFRLAWNQLKLFYQYHLELEANGKVKKESELRLYVSIIRKQSFLEKEEFKYYALEALLNHFDFPIAERQSIYAVARIIPNYENYKINFLKKGESGIEFESVNFYSQNGYSSAPRNFSIEGYPQVTLASKLSNTPVWNHNYCFSLIEEKDTMFEIENSALVIEFYPSKKITGKSWKIKDLLGWCAITLDSRCRKSLETDEADYGLRTEAMLVEGDGSLVAQNHKYLTAEVILRLIPDKHPKRILKSTNVKNVPVLQSHCTEENIQNGITPVYLQPKRASTVQNLPIVQKVKTPPKSPQKMPVVQSEPIIQQVPVPVALPRIQQQFIPIGDFQETYLKPIETYLPMIDTRRMNDPDKLLLFNRDDFSDVPIDYRYAFLNYKQPSSYDKDGWIYYYKNLLSCYRALVRKMNEDLNLYKNQIRNLELSNIELLTKMKNFENKKSVLLKLAEINEMDRSNLNSSFLELRTRLAVKTNENLILKEQVDRLQKELERKSVLESDLNKAISAQTAQSHQIQLMQERLGKAYGLEDTVKRQEIVIEKLEGYIKKILKNQKDTSFSDYRRFRDEFNDIQGTEFDT